MLFLIGFLFSTWGPVAAVVKCQYSCFPIHCLQQRDYCNLLPKCEEECNQYDVTFNTDAPCSVRRSPSSLPTTSFGYFYFIFFSTFMPDWYSVSISIILRRLKMNLWVFIFHVIIILISSFIYPRFLYFFCLFLCFALISVPTSYLHHSLFPSSYISERRICLPKMEIGGEGRRWECCGQPALLASCNYSLRH